MINDVWYNIQQNVHFLTRSSFSQAPAVPAVYAWYYPLRVSTYDLREFMLEVLSVMSYDAKSEGETRLESTLTTTWRSYRLELAAATEIGPTPAGFVETWKNACEEDFDRLRMDLMRLSLFMPPLYVGKTNNLSRRIREHLEGRPPARGFHERFEEFAGRQGLSQKTIADLLCVAITSPSEASSDDYVSLVEYIMKTLAAPGFSIQ